AEEAAFEAGLNERWLRDRKRALQEEREAVLAKPGSNIPLPFQQFRTELAERLSLSESILPFVAELVQVKEEEHHWRGAIERGVGAHRLRILVPPEHIYEALSWVNQRHNCLHVR